MHREKKKVINKVKLPLNQHASRQPSAFASGRASLVKRTLAGPCGLKEEKDSEINYTSHS